MIDLETSQDQGPAHECFCNMCGDDLQVRGQKIAETKFDQFKTEFLQEQKTQQKDIQMDSENTEVNREAAQLLKQKELEFELA